MGFREDLILDAPVAASVRATAGTSITMQGGVPGNLVLPCTALVFRPGTTGVITGLTVTAWVNGVTPAVSSYGQSTMTVSSTIPAGFVDAQVNIGDQLVVPSPVVTSDQGVATRLCLQSAYVPQVVDTDGSTVTFDWSASGRHKVTLAGSRTFAFSNVTIGQELEIEIVQGGSGSYTVTWPSGIKWSGGAPTLTTSVGAIDIVKIRAITLTTFRATAALAYS
jgi:hypothetical protein